MSPKKKRLNEDEWEARVKKEPKQQALNVLLGTSNIDEPETVGKDVSGNNPADTSISNPENSSKDGTENGTENGTVTGTKTEPTTVVADETTNKSDNKSETEPETGTANETSGESETKTATGSDPESESTDETKTISTNRDGSGSTTESIPETVDEDDDGDVDEDGDEDIDMLIKTILDQQVDMKPLKALIKKNKKKRVMFEDRHTKKGIWIEKELWEMVKEEQVSQGKTITQIVNEALKLRYKLMFRNRLINKEE